MLADRPADPRVAPVRDLPIIAHLASRWDPTWHRPHRLLRTLGAQAPVLVVEDAVVLDDVRRERLDLTEVAPGVQRALPRLPAYLREYDRAAGTTRALLQAAMHPQGALRGRFTGAAHWFSHVGPAPQLLGAFGEVGTIYDCLAADTGTATDRGAAERQLLAAADLVLVSSDEAAAAMAERHQGVLRLEDGVDAELWSTARDASLTLPADVASLPRPIFGYFGPVDDRIAHELLRALRARVPEGSIVLVGPPGLPPAEGSLAPALPDGVHWLGAREERALPAYAKAFDVCIFPLLESHATLAAGSPMVVECLAAGRPVVTSVRTALPEGLAFDVRVSNDPRGFAEAAVTLARGDEPTTASAAAVSLALLGAASWERVALRLRGVLFESIATRPVPMAAIADAIIASRGLPGSPPSAA